MLHDSSHWVTTLGTLAGVHRTLMLPTYSLWFRLPCTPAHIHSPLTLPEYSLQVSGPVFINWFVEMTASQ